MHNQSNRLVLFSSRSYLYHHQGFLVYYIATAQGFYCILREELQKHTVSNTFLPLDHVRRGVQFETLKAFKIATPHDNIDPGSCERASYRGL